MVRHFDQEDREAEGAEYGNALKSILTKRFRNDGAEKCTDSQWWNYTHKGSNRVRFECCETFQNDLVYVRAIQGHSGGETIAPDLMNHVLLTLKWKDIMYHKGSIFNMKSIIADGLVPGGKESGRQTKFSLHLIHLNQMMKTKIIMKIWR